VKDEHTTTDMQLLQHGGRLDCSAVADTNSKPDAFCGRKNSPQELADVWPILPFVVNPVGQGTQARCFFIPGPYVFRGHMVAEGVPAAVISYE
jgi:hypothetical protein